MLLPQSCTALTAAGYVPWDTEVVRRTFPSMETAYTLQAVMIPLGTEGLNYITLTEEEESARSRGLGTPNGAVKGTKM